MIFLWLTKAKPELILMRSLLLITKSDKILLIIINFINLSDDPILESELCDTAGSAVFSYPEQGSQLMTAINFW